MRRRDQLELLTAAAAVQADARLVVRNAEGWSHTAGTYLVTLTPECLWVDQPLDFPSGELLDRRCEVFFLHDGARYAFSSRTRRTALVGSPAGEVPALAIAIPLCIERREQRRGYRIALDDAPIRATLTPMLEERQRIACRLLNLSYGGIGAIAESDEVSALSPGDLLWARFHLTEAATPLEFAVRLAHRQPARSGSQVVLGCAFCPGDDASETNRKLEQVRHFIAARQRRAAECPKHAFVGE
ncbi:MAG: Flagellar brake protein YcgR [Phycisphaerae bacterium]|nr:Flagellar brake protein YcgR [Phycisphaerae bacterium]